MTNDRAASGGHFYCDKAVLTSAAGALVLAPAQWLGLRDLPDALPVGGVGRYLVERVVCGMALFLLLVLLRRHLRQEGGPALASMAALGLGSILLPYSTVLYGHVPAATLIFASYHLQSKGRYLGADVAGALACGFEFPVLLLYGILLLYRPRSCWKPISLIRVPAILLLALSPQMMHNWISFGDPITMGYSLETEKAFEGMSEGFFGFTYPRLVALRMLLLSPERGLLFYMPWVALGFAGFFAGSCNPIAVFRRNPLPICIVAYVLLFSAYYMPGGGWAFGPRHVIPVIPFAAVGLSSYTAYSPRRRFVSWVLLLPAILQALIGTFGEIHQPVHPGFGPLALPQMEFGIGMMLDGHHSYWLLGTTGVALMIAGSLIVWFLIYAGSKPTSWGALGLAAWFVVFALGFEDSGGKVDYYRGVMAEHRREYELAIQYYTDALEDPSAPEGYILLRMRGCQSELDGLVGKSI
ncbi:hypothetical protein GF402_04850 [Candidatus Fermentibacteria bacterium]|nr:hypothetical protein [Candidatus Fermentibacteria bacterium]